ncbi:nuclear transport factor 2 family protein [Kribbella sp. NPDC048928]|uniref:nuclear transport factor 2 family protein n=1 Tax=Kribbella sp. NPDC048928 TaxID=3364111 RepID=UPI0037141C5B
MSTDISEFAGEYFAAAVDPERERYFALFADDVVVHDDGRTHRGLADVRAWRAEVPSVQYAVHEVSGDPAACVAVAEISGDFPGSPVVLRFSFERDVQGRITLLDIAP